jgi:TrmH family RNA methyltransferase
MKASAGDIKYVQSLQQKKFRRQHGVFVAEGAKIVKELLSSDFEIEAIYGVADWIEQNNSSLQKGTSSFTVSENDLGRISGLKTPNQVLAVVKTPTLHPEPNLSRNKVILALDTLQDPGNLGTIIRTADWFGIRQIVCSQETADVFSPKVIQATMGSFLRVSVLYTDLAGWLETVRHEVPIYGAFPEGDNMFEVRPGTGGILVIGNESAGISAGVSKWVSKRIKIPGGLPSSGGFSPDSLNASIAAGILMSVLTRT